MNTHALAYRAKCRFMFGIEVLEGRVIPCDFVRLTHLGWRLAMFWSGISSVFFVVICLFVIVCVWCDVSVFEHNIRIVRIICKFFRFGSDPTGRSDGLREHLSLVSDGWKRTRKAVWEFLVSGTESSVGMPL